MRHLISPTGRSTTVFATDSDSDSARFGYDPLRVSNAQRPCFEGL
ncbi:hypothetical protein SAMN04487917_10349 [Arthrobacter sp. yr096]|nr:hypothetical protein SAMN04487917_10349 [Arthrobacter sp. yr096]